MIKGELSQPKTITGNIVQDIKEQYNEYSNKFLDQKNRPELKGCFIHVDETQKYGMNERFLHVISMEDKKYYEKILPCTNDIAMELCRTSCQQNLAQSMFQSIHRLECYYRLARVSWIWEIIDLCNNDNEYIKVWRFDSKDKSGKWYWTRYVRYKKGTVDYVIIFNEVKTKQGEMYLDFRTAYQVYLRDDRKSMDKQYNIYLKNMNNKNTGLPIGIR